MPKMGWRAGGCLGHKTCLWCDPKSGTLLDYYISCYCVQKAHKLEPVIRNILRIGGYQILFMDKIPHRAAVNEAVEMCRRNGRPRAAGMVNAVLRKFVTNWMNMPEIRCSGTAEYLSIRYSHPLWLVKRLLEILPPEEAEQFLRGNNEIVPTTIHTNLLKTDDETLVEELKQAGIAVERHPWLEHCFTVSGTAIWSDCRPLRRGALWCRTLPHIWYRWWPGPKKVTGCRMYALHREGSPLPLPFLWGERARSSPVTSIRTS